MAICFDCWQLIQVNDVKPKRVYASALYRYNERVEPKDLMQEHWNYSCSKAKTRDGSARIIQLAYRRFREKEPSNARLAWNSLPNDGTSDDEKFLTLIPHKIKNPTPLDRIKMRLNKEYAEYIKKYNRYPVGAEFKIRTYKEYIIPDDWIGRKKSQLRERFRKRLLEIET